MTMVNEKGINRILHTTYKETATNYSRQRTSNDCKVKNPNRFHPFSVTLMSGARIVAFTQARRIDSKQQTEKASSSEENRDTNLMATAP